MKIINLVRRNYPEEIITKILVQDEIKDIEWRIIGRIEYTLTSLNPKKYGNISKTDFPEDSPSGKLYKGLAYWENVVKKKKRYIKYLDRIIVKNNLKPHISKTIKLLDTQDIVKRNTKRDERYKNELCNKLTNLLDDYDYTKGI